MRKSVMIRFVGNRQQFHSPLYFIRYTREFVCRGQHALLFETVVDEVDEHLHDACRKNLRRILSEPLLQNEAA